MAYLGLSPDYPDQYFSEIPSPGDADNCARYCAWLASRKGGIVTMEYMERPPGCICPHELEAAIPVPLPSPGKIQLTPQQIEAQVKQIQPAPTGGGLALAAIAAFLILGA